MISSSSGSPASCGPLNNVPVPVGGWKKKSIDGASSGKLGHKILVQCLLPLSIPENSRRTTDDPRQGKLNLGI